MERERDMFCNDQLELLNEELVFLAPCSSSFPHQVQLLFLRSRFPCCLSQGVPCLSLYSLESRVTDLKTNSSRLQLP
jgi:hypothetical protein